MTRVSRSVKRDRQKRLRSQALLLWHVACFGFAVSMRALPLLLCLTLAGCAGGGTLQASLEAPPVEISGLDSTKELRFRAEAHTSAPVLEGLVRVVVRPEGPTSSLVGAADGQVRVTVYRGPDGVEDVTPTNDVVRAGATSPIEVPKDALAGCQGSCSESFVVVFAAEGLRESPVAFPIVLHAELAYEYAAQVPEGDFLRLTLE